MNGDAEVIPGSRSAGRDPACLLKRYIEGEAMIPGNVIFAHSGKNKVTYDDVRSQSESEKLQSLELRMKSWLIDQISPLGNKKVYSPFPLAVLTCVAIESTSYIFLRCESGTDDERTLFSKFMLLMDGDFKPPMQKGFLKSMRKRWPTLDFNDCKSVPEILYKSFRNSLTHAYRSYGVYITEDETDSWKYCDGFIQLNPYWFWHAFHSVYLSLFDSVRNNTTDNGQRECCLKYICEMLI